MVSEFYAHSEVVFVPIHREERLRKVSKVFGVVITGLNKLQLYTTQVKKYIFYICISLIVNFFQCVNK